MEITSVLFDPGLGCAAFTVERITCTRSRGGTKSHSVTEQAQQKTAVKSRGGRRDVFVREYIDGQIPPPNSPVALSGGWIYNRVAKKGVYVEGKNGSTPMRDTDALYNDFDYEVTNR